MFNWLKKIYAPLLIIAVVLWCFGDVAQLAVTVYSLSAAALVLLIADLFLDKRAGWGLFPTLDIDAAIGKAQETPQSAAILVAAIIAFLIAILFLSVPGARAEVPPRARPLLPVLSSVLSEQWPAAPLRHVPAGQVEQESGWKEKATLRTSRELGRGLVQMTVAYDRQGRERFNIYRDAVRARALKSWDWQRDPYNARYQLTFLALQDRANFTQVRPYMVDDVQGWKASLVCYNAGSGRWLARRAQARLMGLPRDVWDGGLDRAHSPGENTRLYDRPLWQAVNEYPAVVFKRAQKYTGLV